MTDATGRHAPDVRPARVVLALILLAAAALRLYRVDSGIPFAIGIDEPEIMVRAVRMMQTGDFNPHFFDYPSLTIYLHLFVAIARFLFGAATHEFHALAEVDFTDFLAWSRTFTALLGVATVYVTYRIGLRWSRWHGLLAAALLAVLPMHVREARFALTDVPMTLCAAATVWAALVARERATLRAFAIAATMAGLALGMKYTAGLVLLVPLVAVWTSAVHVRVRLRWTALVVVVWAATFLVVAPYTVIDLPGFLDGFAVLMTSYRPRALAEAPWITYLKHVRIAFGSAGTALLAGGLVLAGWRIVRGPARARWALVTVLPVLHYLALIRQDLVFARYLLPLMPCACVLVASAIVAAFEAVARHVSSPRARRLLAGALVVVALTSPLAASVTLVRLAGRTSTQAETYAWLVAHVPAGTTVVIEKFEVRLSGAQYKPVYLTRLIERSYDEHVRSGARYMVATSQMYGPALASPEQDPVRYRAYMTLFAQAREVARFTPAPGRPGPELIVFEIR